MPPSGNAGRVAAQVVDCVYRQLQRTQDAPVLILGDFNHCKLEMWLPGFEQYIKCDTRNGKTLDKCYGNIQNAYTARVKPPLSNSDHKLFSSFPSIVRS